MPRYTLNRNYVHRSRHGHSIAFVPDEPVWVPPGPVEAEVAALGAECVDGEAPDLVPAEAVAPVQSSEDELTALMREAFKELIARNDSADFTGAGVPAVKAVEKLIGEDVSARQIADLWRKLQEEGAL